MGKVVAGEFFVIYAYVVVDATEEQKERLSGQHVRIRGDNKFNESSAALIYHDVEWICFKKREELIYEGIMYTLNRDIGRETEKRIVNLKYEIRDHIHNIETLEYIYK